MEANKEKTTAPVELDQVRRIQKLEEEMAVLVQQLKDRRAILDKVEAAYKSVLIEFVNTYGLTMPDCLK